MSNTQQVVNFEELRTTVDSQDGLYTTTMEVLRDAYGKGRLGPHVREGIHKALAGMGLGHYPQTLPEYQHEQVRLYRFGSPVGDLIDAVLYIDPQKDEQLRRVASGSEAAILQQIRELVCS